jgi:hypothetical protein
MSFSIDDGSDMKLIVYTPLAAQDSVAKMKALLGNAPVAAAATSRAVDDAPA